MIDIREERQKEFSNIIAKTLFTGIYVISPRVGKTKITIDSLRGIGNNWNILIGTPRETINMTWKFELAKWNSDISPEIFCIKSLKKYKDVRPDLLIIDECQVLSANQIKLIKEIRPKRLLLLTGTLRDTRCNLLKSEFKLEKHINYTIDEAISDGIIADYEINIITVELTKDEKAIYNYMTNKYNYLLEQSMQNSNYNVAKNVQARKRMFNVYNTKSKVESVREFIGNLKERFILFSAYSTISFDLLPESSFNSINKRYDRLEAFMNEEANSLGVIKMVDFGVTFPNLKIGIIQQIQTNEELFLQRALRCCNLDKDGRIAKIYIFVCKDTVDEKWLAQALKNVKKERIKYMEKNFEYK